MSDPLAFLLTFRTYGTWLHGDERSSVDRAHNTPGTPYLSRNASRETWERERQRFPALVFNEDMRRVVDAAIVAECAFRGWELLQRAVRTNHVHVIVSYAGLRPEKMAGLLKSHATRRLRKAGLIAPNRAVWADGVGSRRYLWRPEHIHAAEEYIRDGQDVPR